MKTSRVFIKGKTYIPFEFESMQKLNQIFLIHKSNILVSLTSVRVSAAHAPKENGVVLEDNLKYIENNS